MALLRRDDTVVNALGNAISGATCYYLGQPANLDALTPLLSIYSDSAGTSEANPQVTDGLGHAVAYLSDGALFTVVYVYPNNAMVVYPDQYVGGTPGNAITPVSASSGAGTITGAIPGSVFTLPSTPMANTLLLQVNGQVLTQNLGYTLAGAVVTLAQALQNGDSIAANYFI